MDLKCVLVGDKGKGETALLGMAILGKVDPLGWGLDPREGYDPLEVTVSV